MEFTTHFSHHSQDNRLYEMATLRPQEKLQPYTGLSPSLAPYSKGLMLEPKSDATSKDYNSDGEGRQILNLSSSHFIRHY